MSNGGDVGKDFVKSSITYMIVSASVGIILGLIMLLYPTGTMAMMETAFIIFQIIVSIFIVYYTVSEAIAYFKLNHPVRGVIYILTGLVATVLIWVFNVSLIYFIIAFFLVLTGIGDIIGSSKLPRARYFLILLGIINILIAIVILKYPVILPLMIAWYVLFWGISRLFLAIELRKEFK